MAEHTPTPWASSKQWLYGPKGYVLPIASGFLEFVTNPGGSGHDEAVANAALIVRAVNSHDALVDALEACHSVTKAYAGDALLKRIAAALALAKGVSAPSQSRAPESDAQSLETREVQS